MPTYYSVNNSNHVHDFESECDWDVTDDLDREMAAQECADDYHANRDGWESKWPLKIALHDPETKKVVARFDVEREFEPVFNVAIVSEG